MRAHKFFAQEPQNVVARGNKKVFQWPRRAVLLQVHIMSMQGFGGNLIDRLADTKR